MKLYLVVYERVLYNVLIACTLLRWIRLVLEIKFYRTQVTENFITFNVYLTFFCFRTYSF